MYNQLFQDTQQTPCHIVYAERVTKSNRNEIRRAKVLFLGAAESGKSTLCRQIRILHGCKFSDEEILRFKHHIRVSCLKHFITIINDYLEDTENRVNHENEEIRTILQFLEDYKRREYLQDFERSYLNKSVNIWRNSSLQKFMLASVRPMGIPSIISTKRLHADNPASHFLPSLSRIMAKGYSPTSEDILSVRIPTSGQLYSEL